jgi:hypothetical protein
LVPFSSQLAEAASVEAVVSENDQSSRVILRNAGQGEIDARVGQCKVLLSVAEAMDWPSDALNVQGGRRVSNFRVVKGGKGLLFDTDCNVTPKVYRAGADLVVDLRDPPKEEKAAVEVAPLPEPKAEVKPAEAGHKTRKEVKKHIEKAPGMPFDPRDVAKPEPKSKAPVVPVPPAKPEPPKVEPPLSGKTEPASPPVKASAAGEAKKPEAAKEVPPVSSPVEAVKPVEKPEVKGDPKPEPKAEVQAEKPVGKAGKKGKGHKDQPESVAEPVTAPAPVAEVLLPPPFALADWHSYDFLAKRASLMDDLGHRVIEGKDVTRPALDLAQFYFAWQMVPEGEGALANLPADLSPEDALEAKSYRQAFAILKGKVDGVEIFTDLAYQNQIDWPLWTAVAWTRKGKYAEANALLDIAWARLQQYPKEYRRSFLPVLIETAIENERWDIGKEMMLALDGLPLDEADKVSVSYLLGRAAQKLGRLKDAFDAYSKAALALRGRDSQRARIALIDMGIRTKRMKLDDAIQFLEEGRFEWRGDQLEAEVLKRLASLYHLKGDKARSAIALGDLVRRFRDTPDGIEAQKEAEQLLDEIYGDGVSGKMPIAKFMEFHNALKPSFENVPSFAPRVRKFAAHLKDIGLSVGAAREYEYLLKIALSDEDQASAGAALAEAYLIAGDLKAARDALERTEHLASLPVMKARSEVAARIEREAGRFDEAAKRASMVKDSGEMARIQAEALWNAQDWEGAKKAYLALKTVFPDRYSSLEALRLLLAAHRTGDNTLEIEVASEHPELIGSKEWMEIANGMVKNTSVPDALNRTQAEEKINESGSLSDLIGKATGLSLESKGGKK